MKIKIPLQIVEPNNGSFHIIAAGKFADGNEGFWPVDTGASITVFDKNLTDYYTIESESDETHSTSIGDKSISTKTGILKTFFLSEFKVEKIRVALIDLSHINKLYRKNVNIQICGLIGGDFLKKYDAVIDYREKTLLLKY